MMKTSRHIHLFMLFAIVFSLALPACAAGQPGMPKTVSNATELPQMSSTDIPPTTPRATTQTPGSRVTDWQGVPILSGSQSGREVPSGYMYIVQSTLDVVQNYYEQTMPKLGWQTLQTGVGPDEGTVQLAYLKDGKTATITLAVDGENVVVRIILE